MIFWRKNVFRIVNASLRWLNNVWHVLNPGILAFYWILDISSGIGPCMLPIGWRIVQMLRQRQRKTTNAESVTLSAIQAAS